MVKFSLFSEYLAKAEKEKEAYELAFGTYELEPDGSIIPMPRNKAGWEEFRRISSIVTSVGPKILTRKLDGIVGTFTHNGNDQVSRILDEDYDIRYLIDRVARDLVVKGSAALAIGVDEDGSPYVYRLGGFITKLVSENDIDKEVGVLQIENSGLPNAPTYDVRIFRGNIVEHWVGVKVLENVNWSRPHHVYENAVQEVAFYAEYMSDDEGMSIGEMEQVAPLIKGILSVETMIHRNLGSYAYPFIVMKGSVQWARPGEERTPTNILTVSEGGSVELLAPPSGEHLLRAKDALFQEMTEVATLPKGFMGKNPPSGEAVRESSAAFNASVTRYAKLISRLFTNVFYEFFTSQGINVDGFIFTVTPNVLRNTIEDITKAVELLQLGLLTPEYVVEIIRRHFEGISEETALQILQRFSEMTSVPSPDEILAEVV